MPSKIWTLDPSESYERPYEYAVRDQFQREATKLLSKLYHLLNSNNKYTIDERTVSKACWLLVMEALDCLRESLAALKQKRHRIVSALLRTEHEVLDLAKYLHAQGETKSGARHLSAWYRDEIIEHKVYRNWIKERDGSTAVKIEADKYRSLSRFTHRTYQTLLLGYLLGKSDCLVHDATGELFDQNGDGGTKLVLPHTVSLCFSLHAQSILHFVKDVGDLEIVALEILDKTVLESLESEYEPWRFTTRKEIYERFLKCPNNQQDDESASEVDG